MKKLDHKNNSTAHSNKISAHYESLTRYISAAGYLKQKRAKCVTFSSNITLLSLNRGRRIKTKRVCVISKKTRLKIWKVFAENSKTSKRFLHYFCLFSVVVKVINQIIKYDICIKNSLNQTRYLWFWAGYKNFLIMFTLDVCGMKKEVSVSDL